MAQFGTWQDSLFVLLGMFAIQFAIGNYLEPLVAGAALSISPLAVVFAVFFFGFLWGMPGAFLGVPILIAIVMLCAHYPSTRWIATLLSGTPKSRELDDDANYPIEERWGSRSSILAAATSKPTSRAPSSTPCSRLPAACSSRSACPSCSWPGRCCWSSRAAARPRPDRRLRLGAHAVRQHRHARHRRFGRFSSSPSFSPWAGSAGARLFRLVENSFWALNSVVVQPGYAATREVLRQIAEKPIRQTRQQGPIRETARRLGHCRRASHLRRRAARALSRLSERRALRQLRRDRRLAEPDRRGARQQRRADQRLSRRRRPDLGRGRRHHGAAPRSRRLRPSGPTRREDYGASCICPTSMSSASATAFASRADGPARAAMSG